MIEFYPQIKQLHIACVVLSGLLFFIRASAVAANARWPNALPLRYLSYTIDSALLTSAMMLLTILPSAVFANGWLWVKLALLVCYVVLGSFALKRGRTAKTRAVCSLAAVLTYLLIASIALAHHPLGALKFVRLGEPVHSDFLILLRSRPLFVVDADIDQSKPRSRAEAGGRAR
jgi:uncharacterized membrane protein SirB2